MPDVAVGHRREPVGRRPVRRQGHRRDGQQRTGTGDLRGDPRRRRRVGHRAAGHARARAARAARPSATARASRAREGKRVIFDEADLGDRRRRRGLAPAVQCPRMSTPSARSGTWNGVERTSSFPGIRLNAIGGEQVCLCLVTLRAGQAVPLHSHEHTEQVMVHHRRRRHGDDRGRVAARCGPATSWSSTAASSTRSYSEGGVHLLRGPRTGPARPHPGPASATSCSARTEAPRTSSARRMVPGTASGGWLAPDSVWCLAHAVPSR